MGQQFTPTSLSPEFITFDATQSYTFKWTPQGMPQVYYQVYIYKISDNTLAYSSSKTASSVGSFTLSGGSLTNGISYKWRVDVYQDITNYISSEYISFSCAVSPTVTLGATPTNVQNYLFTATYTTASTTQIQKFRFILYDNFNSIIQDSRDIYGFNVQYQINGLISSFPYKIECIVTDQNNLTGTTGKVAFSVTYTSASSVNLFTVTALDDEGAIKIDFNQINQTSGTITGTSSYTTGKFNQGLQLDIGSYIDFVYNVPTIYTLTFYTKLPTNFTGDVMKFDNGTFRVFYDGSRYGYQFGDYITCGSLRSLPSPSEFIKIAVKYGKIIVQTSLYTEYIF